MQELLGQAERVADQLSGELKMWDYVEGEDQRSRIKMGRVGLLTGGKCDLWLMTGCWLTSQR